jgi:plasmid replication initiation protein
MKLLVATKSSRDAHVLGADARDAANDDLTPEDVDAEVRRLEAEKVAADLQYNREKADGTWHAEREARALRDPMAMLSGRGYGGDW